MSARTQAKAPSRKVTPPSGSYMSNDQFGASIGALCRATGKISTESCL